MVLGRSYPQSTLRDTSIHFKPFHSSVEFLIETSDLVFFTNEMTGFYKKCNTDWNWVKGLGF